MARSPIYNFTMTMDGTFQKIEIEKDWYNLVVQMRDSTSLLISADGTDYYTVKSGLPFGLASHNFSIEDTDEIYVKASSGTLECIAFIRY